MKVHQLANNKRVLDVFSYSGGFTVHALCGGAKHVTSIDISKQALDVAKSNVKLNGDFDNHETIGKDAFEALQQLNDQRQKFDLVVIDPPSFAKNQAEIHQALQGYKRLAKLAVSLVEKEGILMMASCSARVVASSFYQVIGSILNDTFRPLSTSEHDFDHPIVHPESAYLKTAFFQKKIIQMDSTTIRSYFPALSDDYIFLDNAGGTQILSHVVERITSYYKHLNVQLGGLYSKSIEAREELNKASAFMAAFMNARSSNEVVIGTSTTMLIRLLSICIGQTLQPGDQIIVSQADHEANRSPWIALQDKGIEIIPWSFDPESMALEATDLTALITENKMDFNICHVSNIFGTIHPIESFTRIAHRHHCKIFVDGVAYAPHRAIDVRGLECRYICL